MTYQLPFSVRKFLSVALPQPPRKEVTARRYDREAGHGRSITRSVRTFAVTGPGPGLDFPHVVHAVKILRYRTGLKTERRKVQ